MIAESEFQRDMRRMQTLFNAVKHKYDLFFAGTIKDPPFQERSELDRLVSKYNNASLNRLSQQFLFSSFMEKVMVHSELWNKWIRAREDGLVSDPRIAGSVMRAKKALKRLDKGLPAEEEDRQTGKAAPPPKIEKKTAPKKGSDPTSLYEAFIAAKLQAGEAPKWSLEGFKSHVERQRDAILAKYGCKDVIFSVQSKKGKVSLKARIVK